MLELRDYQKEAVDSLFSYWGSKPGSPLIVLPTGAGKSLVLSEINRRIVTDYPDMRILNVTHVKELIEGNYMELIGMWRQAPAGIFSAGVGRRDSRSQIIFGGVQTIYNKAHVIGHIDLVTVDEAHLMPRNSETRYGQLVSGLQAINPDLKLMGLTATHFRLGEGYLHHGDGAIFDDICYEKPIIELIDEGYLVRPISKGMATGYDLSGVGKRGGDYKADALQDAVDRDDVTRSVVNEIVEYGQNRRAWLAFCAGVEHAFHMRDEIRSRGYSCETIHGGTPKEERAQIIRDFKDGKIRALTNNSVLTTGTNMPIIDLVAFCRPTMSPGLYIQMAGRGLRLYPGKENCIAEGQRVLTDVGLVPIEQVTKDMKVWDGANFVCHGGVICHGLKDVITYAGLTATPDHKVWSNNEWIEFEVAAKAGAAISVTGNGRSPIRETEGYKRGGVEARKESQAISGNGVLRMRNCFCERLHKPYEWLSRMSIVWKSAIGSALVVSSLLRRETEVHAARRSSVGEVRRERDRVPLHRTNGNGCMDQGEPRTAQGDGDRSNRQRWPLRGRESEVFHGQPEPVTYAKEDAEFKAAQIQKRLSFDKVCGFDFARFFWEGDDAGGDSREVPHALKQTKRRVWDILDAGPLHRFTVEGLLVHNCLFLDFAGLVMQHGPIDRVRPPDVRGGAGEGGGEAPAKLCPQDKGGCGSLVHPSVTVCPDCGYEFPVDTNPKINKTADDAPMLSTDKGQVRQVESRTFRYHESKSPEKPPTVKVTYVCNGGAAHNEWLCPEHKGYPKSKANKYWHLHGGSAPFPNSVMEWLERQNELLVTDGITLEANGRYWSVAEVHPGSMKQEYVEPEPEPTEEQRSYVSFDDEIPF